MRKLAFVSFLVFIISCSGPGIARKERELGSVTQPAREIWYYDNGEKVVIIYEGNGAEYNRYNENNTPIEHGIYRDGSFIPDYNAKQFYAEYWTIFFSLIGICILWWVVGRYKIQVIDLWRKLTGKVIHVGEIRSADSSWCMKCQAYRSFEQVREEEKMSMKFIVSKCTVCDNETVKRIEE